MEFVRSLFDRLGPSKDINGTAADTGASNSTAPLPVPELPPSFLGEHAAFYAYGALLVMACVPIILGSRSSIKFPKEKKPHVEGQEPQEEEAEEDEREFFRLEDAKLFPIIGSVTLFGLFLLFTYFDKEYINYLLTAYFAMLGVGALVKGIMSVSRAVSGKRLKGEYRLEMWKGEKEILSYPFSVYLLIVISFSLILTVIYVLHKHWLLSNIYGEAFSVTAIQLLSLDSFQTGMVLLSGLFFYDIFWVFFTPVMVTVAKSFDAPIKVVFPKDFGQLGLEGWFGTPPRGVTFTMLGLGDIVIPGIFIALCLRFDHHMHVRRASGKKAKGSVSRSQWDFPKPYFNHTMISYIFGLVTTVVVMHTFQAAQPALLYLSPACILSVLGTAFYRGELKQLFEYAEGDDEDEAKAIATEAALPEAPKVVKGKAAKSAKSNGTAVAPAAPSTPPGGPNKRQRRLEAKLTGVPAPAKNAPVEKIKDVDVDVKEMAAFRRSQAGGAR